MITFLAVSGNKYSRKMIRLVKNQLGYVNNVQYQDQFLYKYIELIISCPTSQNITFYCFIMKNCPQFLSIILNIRRQEIKLNQKLQKQAELLIKQIKFNSAPDLQTIVIEFFGILLIKDSYQQKAKICELKNKIIQLQDKENLYRQYCINFLKKQMEELIDNQQFLCCRFLFIMNEIIKSNENNVQQFKKYFFPMTENITLHLKKTVVSFLNRRGGIIYIGLEEDKNKIFKIVGIYLKPLQIKQFISFMKKEIINHIYPKFSYEKSCEQISYQNNALKLLLRKKAFQYYLNKYISIEFMPIMDNNTFLNKENIYLIRIKVKPGQLKQFYHLLSPKPPFTPQFYYREDKTVKKKNLIEGLKEFSERLNSEVIKQQFYRPYHVDCTFSLYPHDFNSDKLTLMNQKIVEQKIRKSVTSSKQSQKIVTKPIEKQKSEQDDFWISN